MLSTGNTNNNIQNLYVNKKFDKQNKYHDLLALRQARQAALAAQHLKEHQPHVHSHEAVNKNSIQIYSTASSHSSANFN